MSANLGVNAVHHALPAHELVVSRGQEQVVMHSSQSAMELLANTLPYALAAKDHRPLLAWLQYYAKACS